MSEKKCPSCAFDKISQDAQFCPECGLRMPDTNVKCGKCGSQTPASTFCTNCGARLFKDEAPDLVSNRWVRNPEDFATRVDVDDVKGVIQKGLIVEYGTRALLFLNGVYSGTLDPGKHSMGNIGNSVKNFIGVSSGTVSTAILVDAGDIELGFKFKPDDNIATADPLRISLECALRVNVEEPNLLFVNLMKGRINYTLKDLRDYLAEEVRQGLAELLRQKSVKELSSDLSQKEAIETLLAKHLKVTLQRTGLLLRQVRTFNFSHEQINALTRQREQIFLFVESARADQDGRRQKFGVKQEEWQQDLVEEGGQVDQFQRRAEVWDRMGKAENVARMDQFRTREDWDAFKHEMDKSGLIRQEEWDELVDGYDARKVDRQSAREHMMQMLQQKRDGEFHRSRIQTEQELAGMEIKGKLGLDETKMDWTRTQHIKDHLADKQTEIITGQTNANLRDLDRGSDEKDAMSGLSILERMKAIKEQEALNEQKRNLVDRGMTMQEKEAAAKLERERIAALSGASAEALIAMTDGPDRAKLLAELKKTETMKGMSEEQILAMAAGGSGEVAKAFQEKYKSRTADEIKAQYDKMIEEQREHTKEMTATQQQMHLRQQQMFDTLAKVTETLAGRPTAPPVIYPPQGPGASAFATPYGTVYNAPGGGGGGYAHGGEPSSPPEQKMCVKCGNFILVQMKFCDKCGSPQA